MELAAAHAPSNHAPPTDSDEALDQLLRQIITGFFVLTDGQGALSKWSDPAEMLFDLPAEDALGEPFFGRLVNPVGLSPQADGWRAFLEHGDVPGGRGMVSLDAARPGGGTFPMETAFIPVKLDEGFDFSLFLEDLSFELPLDLMLLRMRQQHPVVIKALRAALAEEQQPWEDWRTAGTLVAFRPLTATPWMDEAMRRREEEAAAAEEELQARIAAYEAPGVQGSDVYDLEDARAVIDRLRWATERINELDERSKPGGDGTGELVARIERIERDAAEIAAVEARGAVERAREELVTRLSAVEQQRAADDGEVAALRAELEQLRGHADASAADLRLALEAQAGELRGAVDGVRGELHEVREAAQHAREAADGAHGHAEAAREEARQAREGADGAREDARVAREGLDAVREDVHHAREAADGAREDARHAREGVDGVRDDARAARETAGMAAEDARAARERVELVDRGASGVLGEVRAQQARVEETGELARAAHEQSAALRHDLDALLERTVGREEMEALNANLAEVRATPTVPDGLDARLDALGEGVSGALGRLEDLAGELSAVRGEAGDGRGALEHRLGEVAAELNAARADAEAAVRGLDGLRDEVGALREAAADARAEAEAAREAAHAAREAAAARDASPPVQDERFEALLAEVKAAAAAAVAARQDAEAARASAEKVGASSAATTEKFAEVWKEMVHASPRPAPAPTPFGRAPTRVSAPKQEAPPARAERPGFDDVAEPLAMLDLKGKFKELNPAFSKLVGYREHEFGKATWPSVLDRGLYHDQMAELEAVVAGELEVATVQSTYMHGQGLMVLVRGELRLVRDEAGAPAGLLMKAEATVPNSG